MQRQHRASDGEISDVLSQWARWRERQRYDDNGLGFPKSTNLGKLLDGLPSTTCTLCHGRKQIPGHKVNAHARFVPCPLCAGLGNIKANPDDVKVNPAFIRSTAPPSSYGDDPQSERVDEIFCRVLSKRERDVVEAEYLSNGTQEIKAVRLCITYSTYRRVLWTATDSIERMLHAADSMCDVL